MINQYLEIAAAINLIIIALLVTPHTAFSVLWAQVLPFVIGIGLAFFSLAKIMGWPV
jgi:hypothetical protein